MHIVLVGLNHRSAPIELRERLAFRKEELPDVFAKLRIDVGLQEAAIVSTCNRVEIYAAVPELDGAVDRLERFLSDHGRLQPPELSRRLYSYAEPHSIAHLFSVASGLDSMVLGEGEIVHQVKHAYEWARECGATGKVFNALFQRALNTAKAVRTQTAIGRGCTSVGSVAIELAEKIFGHLSGARVLLVGAGKVSELTLRHLAERGVQEIRIMNRSVERAAALATDYGACADGLERLGEGLVAADIVITSTSAPAYVISRTDVEQAMRRRHQRPLCLIDLGVPRNVDPQVAALENVYRFDVDDLQGVVAHAHQGRQQAVSQSQQIINQKVDHFLAWWRTEGSASLGTPDAPCTVSPSAHAAAP